MIKTTMTIQNFGSSRPSVNPKNQEGVARMGRVLLEETAEKRERSETADKFVKTVEETVGADTGTITSKEDVEQLESTVQEDLQFGNNAALYTTAIADFIEREFRPSLLEAGVINELEVDQGRDSIKIPIQPDLQTAADVADDGTLTDDSDDYESLTIQTDFVGLGSTVTVELLRNAVVDLLEDQLRQITNAIERKVDADVISALEDVSAKDGSRGDNNNYNYLGSGNTATYDAVVGAFYDARANNANPDAFVASPEFLKNLFTETDMKDAVAFGTVSDTGVEASAIPQVQQILGRPVLMADQMSANRGHWIDTDRVGYLVQNTGIETMDQQLDNKAAFEVKAVKGFGVGITKPQAVYSVIEDTDEPTV